MWPVRQTGHFTRRTFVGGTAASFACGRAWAQNGAGGNDKVAASIDPAQHLTIGVMIDDKGPFDFVVDTGADHTVISDDVAAALGLARGRTVNVEGIVKTVSAQTVRLNRLSFGPVARENLMVPVLPHGLLGVGGYLGLDVIDGYRVTLDFKHHTLEVHDPLPRFFYNVVPPDEARVSADGHFGHLRATHCRVDGVWATAFLDTGAEISAGNSKLLDALAVQDSRYITAQTVPLSGVTGGTIQGRLTSIDHIRFGDLIFGACDIAIADLEIFDIWGLADRPALLIGMNFLRGFNEVSIDYGRKELSFDLASLVMARNG